MYGDGATGTAFGKSKTVILEPVPTGLNTTNIQSDKATLNWTTVACGAYFTIQYQVHGSNTWVTKKTTGNVVSFIKRSYT